MRRLKAIIYEQVPDGKGGIALRPLTSTSTTLSIPLAASMLGLSRATVYRLVQEDHLKAERPSPGRITISLEALMDYKARSSDLERFEQQMKRDKA